MKNKKLFKWSLIAIPILLIVFITFIIGSSYLEHRNLVKEEKKEFPAPGTLVDVNNDGNKLHVYTKGEGDKTLVFMSGLGTSSPVYDFKVLFDKLARDYRIVVVERAGYGWSEISSSSRDIDTVLKETRQALKLAGEEGPYVLFPHSMAGLEALYWANLYPEEVEVIIGLDPLVPEYNLETEEKPSLSYLITFLTRSGLVRHQPDVFNNNFQAVKKGILTEKESKIARTIFYRRVQTKNMWEEVDMLEANSKKVLEEGKPEIPFHAFISAENEKDFWKESIIDYTKATEGKHFILDGGHYIHLDYPELIAEKSREIIAENN